MNKTKECLQLKKFKQYSTAIELDEIEIEDSTEIFQVFEDADMFIQFNLRSASKVTNIYEEILVFDEISLLGSLGGSLGLFIGFSFYGFGATFLDILLGRLANML